MISSTHCFPPEYYYSSPQFVYQVRPSYIQPQNIVYNPYNLPIQGYPVNQYANVQNYSDGICNVMQNISIKKSLPIDINDNNGNDVNLSNILTTELFFKYVKEKEGSRIIQENFNKIDNNLRREVFNLLLFEPVICDIASDRYGNFVFQVIIENMDDDFKQYFIDVFSTKCVQLSFNRYSCRVVQKILDIFPSEMLKILLHSFQGYITPMALNEFANHVLQKVVKMFPEEDLYGLGVELAANVEYIITNSFGCRVLQFTLEKLCNNLTEEYDTEGDKNEFLRLLLNKIISEPRYCQDAFANYVIQFIMDNKYLRKYAEKIVNDFVCKNFFVYAREKYASHVLEKSLDLIDADVLNRIVNGLFKNVDKKSGNSAMKKIMFDQYGNYIVQRLLAISIEIKNGKRNGSKTLFKNLSQLINENTQSLLRYSSGKKLIYTLSCESNKDIV